VTDDGRVHDPASHDDRPLLVRTGTLADSEIPRMLSRRQGGRYRKAMPSLLAAGLVPGGKVRARIATVALRYCASASIPPLKRHKRHK